MTRSTPGPGCRSTPRYERACRNRPRTVPLTLRLPTSRMSPASSYSMTARATKTNTESCIEEHRVRVGNTWEVLMHVDAGEAQLHGDPLVELLPPVSAVPGARCRVDERLRELHA